ncbi:hypothetical protein PCASD_05193 [Puccinia coronata f. sp. avenae]|uniref:Uncharacterized protein n=1 Tax=Puccinia coronata f. sp. avenae TaxID=200324 RepID=A0A2N5TGW1_9BASI|nr:hypothetical protein PCASD_05193 [Puccinia coronata f. sp. avenae]
MLMGGFRGDEDLHEQGNALHAAASSKSSPFVLSSSGRINSSGRHGNQQKPASSASGVGTHRTPGLVHGEDSSQQLVRPFQSRREKQDNPDTSCLWNRRGLDAHLSIVTQHGLLRPGSLSVVALAWTVF